jgi:hypothetical protein
VTATEKPDPTPATGRDGIVSIPVVGWRVPLPQVPATVTMPIVGWRITAPERESAAYYAVLGGLVLLEVVEWPLAVLLAAGHLLATQTRYRGLRGATEALETL